MSYNKKRSPVCRSLKMYMLQEVKEIDLSDYDNGMYNIIIIGDKLYSKLIIKNNG